ncbi:MAG: PAS domain-containing hybrid sensor histidine kinase/response regulator [Bacteroidales bacterium]|nr:MAG: PAS domain-containing hybrid sensor histidine kinase/response regulator [Bacteroidales bacterium]
MKLPDVIKGLSIEKKVELYNLLGSDYQANPQLADVRNDLNKENVKICPYCKSTDTNSPRIYKGLKRYRCNNCTKTFDNSTNIALSGVIQTERNEENIDNVREIAEESEERYKAIAKYLTDYQYTAIVRDGEVVETIHNESCEMVTGYSPKEFMINPYLWINMVVPEERARVADEFSKIFKKIELPPVEHRIVCKNGEIRWVCNTVIPKYDANGNLVSYDGIVKDITERKRAEEEIRKLINDLEMRMEERTRQLEEININLEEAKYEAEEANRTKSEFLAHMSHDIRTPLNAILGYTELLRYTIIDQTQKDYINSIESSGNSLLTLINDILDLSKIEAGKLDLELEYVDSSFFFSEFERVFSLKVSEKGLKFILMISSDMPSGIYIDEARVRQIIFNLIGNSVKFTREGFIKLNIFTENLANSTEKPEGLIDVIIEVQDTGIGISKDLQKTIFEPFVQGKDFKNRGTGLGLAITKKLLDIMDGTISILSEQGKGSTFTIRIPNIPFLKDYSRTKVDIRIDTTEIEFDKAVILLADDDEYNKNYLRDALKNTNLKIVEADDGIAAYSLAKDIVPNLIIADIQMPQMDGFQLLNMLKADENLKHIPVIAYSASVLKKQKERIHNCEFAGLLIKPVKVTELYAELMNFLPYKSTQRVVQSSTSDLTSEITNLPELIQSLDYKFYDTWKSFEVRQPIGEIRNFGKNLVQLGMFHNSSTITDYGKNLISAADNFNIEAILNLIGKYKSIIENLKSSAKI